MPQLFGRAKDIFQRYQAANPGEGERRREIGRRFRQTGEYEAGRGREAEDVAQERLAGFDAEDAAARSARAQYQTFARDLGRNVEALRGSQVGRGRLTTGFGFEDEDRLVEGSLEDLNRQLVQNALTAQGLNLEAAGGLANLGGARTNRFLDILGSERDASFLEEEMARRKKADKRGGLFGALGTIAKGVGGYLAGGPVGAGVALST
jgi:hypothetical protein